MLNLFVCVSMNRSMQDETHVVWIDNYQKKAKFHNVTFARGNWNDNQWTTKCLFMPPAHLRETTVPLVVLVRDGVVVPAMPNDFMLQVDKFKANMALFGSKAQLARQSECRMKSVDNVPLKPKPCAYPPGPVKTALEANIDGLQNTIPVCITEENIGSNKGFLQVVRREWEQHQARCAATGVQKYLVLLADINIFDRLVKVKCTHSTLLLSFTVRHSPLMCVSALLRHF
jgi:hypothetical protein